MQRKPEAAIMDPPYFFGGAIVTVHTTKAVSPPRYDEEGEFFWSAN